MRGWRWLKQTGLFGLAIVLFVVVMTFSFLYWENQTGSPDRPEAEPESAGRPPSFVGGKYVPPAVLTTVGHLYPDIKFKNGEDLENNVLNRLFEDQLGIRVNYLWTTTGDEDVYINKLNTSIATGQPLPDIVSFKGGQNLYPLLRSGAFRDVGPLFERYASPKWKAAMAQAPEAWDRYTLNGKKMAVPILDGKMNSNEVLYIRQDWLDKLGLKAPSTLEEMETVMDAFVHGDPDGNGLDDTYGLSVSLKNSFFSWMSDAGFVFGAYGEMPDIWNRGTDGKLSYGSVQPTVKQGLTTLKRWMERGYVPKDAEILDEIQATEAWKQGKAGMIVAPLWAAGWPLGDVTLNVPDARFDAYPIPVGPSGLSGTRGTPPEFGAIAINAEMANPEIFFDYMNFVYDNFVDPPPGSPYRWGIAEGYDYANVNGKLTFRDSEAPGGLADPQKYLLSLSLPSVPNLLSESIARINRGASGQTPYDVKNKLLRTPQELKGWKIVESNPSVYKTDAFTGAPTPTMERIGDALDELLHDAMLKIVYGQEPLSGFDRVVARWHELGGDKMTDEVNEWYASLGKTR
ncbi:lipoprotein LipO [Cohnella xylanilytica]|uniref:extracellular solute-binding protein n=1 Tax=Cohnella xylanilytica TaxID=557555 RepID=UPI001B0294D3|nr:extracellular solute-binding protein [Cohnella xylanilytica]GIO15244.1 lipoprotein LipO [Cohnella xylanilytica]